MDMSSRNQYLKDLRIEYLKTKSKKEKSKILDEAEKRTGLERKYLTKKFKPKSNLDKQTADRRKRKQYYDGAVRTALVQMWRIFDYPCGQRLESSLKDETDRLRRQGELRCSDETAAKLKQISFRTIDEKLRHQKEVERLKRKYHQKKNPLLYQKIPIKIYDEQDRTQTGNIQLDLVEHCGQSSAGEFVNTLSLVDLNFGWWEGEAVMGRSQEAVFSGLTLARNRFPFPWLEIHSDNDTAFINYHLLKYCEDEHIGFSRSRPYKKNDNYLVEQKNWTHIRKFAGYYRYDSKAERNILNDLYRHELRLYKNFFQPVMKLIEKERVGGKVRRRYDKAKTPYQRVMKSKEVSEKTKQGLKLIYESLNPAQLKRVIDDKLNMLYGVYQKKNPSSRVKIDKKLKPNTVSFFIAQPRPVSVS